jgi:hypothetical protein
MNSWIMTDNNFYINAIENEFIINLSDLTNKFKLNRFSKI